jgi:hypothetical protein
MYHHPRCFIDHHEGVVLEGHLEVHLLGLDSSWRRRQRLEPDLLSSAETLSSSTRLVIDESLPLIDSPLDLASRDPFEVSREKPIEPLILFLLGDAKTHLQWLT